MISIFRETLQDATNYIDVHSNEPMKCGFDPDDLIYTNCCQEKRQAKYCVVQCYYDSLAIWCKKGNGCKDPAIIEAKKQQEFKNRSEGQKRRWRK